MTAPSIRDLADQVRARASLVELVGARVALKRAGREMRGCCPFHNEKTPSFYVIERKGFFYCFGCGAHGSAIDFCMRLDRLKFASTVRTLAAEAGLVDGSSPIRRVPAAEVPRVSPAEIEDERARDADRAASIWCDAVPGAGTPVETYLRGRAIALPVPPTLRFAAKKMLGQAIGGAVRFAKAGATIAIAEGIETALSVLQVRPDLSVWAVLSLGAMAGSGDPQASRRRRSADDPKTLAAFKAGRTWPRLETDVPDMKRPRFVPPDAVREILLLADTDNKDPPMAQMLMARAAARLIALGLTVCVTRPKEGHDFNSMLMASCGQRGTAPERGYSANAFGNAVASGGGIA